MAAPVVHFEVIGQDFEKLRSFYGELFEWDLQTPGPGPYAVWQADGEGIGGGIGAADEADHVTFYVKVPDLAEALEQAEKLGAKTVMPPSKVNEVLEIAQFEDPEGHRIGLVKG